MNRATSTPYPRKKFSRLLTNDIENSLSPIQEPSTVAEPCKLAPSLKTSKSSQVKYNPDAVINSVIPKQRKQPNKNKGAESASRAVLREMGMSPGSLRHDINTLSVSRNKYDLYPHPVIVESDEEETSVISPIKKPVEKKKNHRTVKMNPAENQRVKKSKHLKEVNGSEKNKATHVQCKPESLPTKDKKASVSKTYLKRHAKQPTKVVEPTNFSEDDLFDDEIIVWTPRAIKNKKRKLDSLSDDEEIRDDIEQIAAQVDVPLCPDVNINSISEGNVETKSLADENKDSEDDKPKFDSDVVSLFKDIVFKHNKHSGGIVARALDCDSYSLGYIEVNKNEVFTGKRSNTTFVVLEGEVRASQPPASQTLVAGDILHIRRESQYTFTCVRGTHARLLYNKNK